MLVKVSILLESYCNPIPIPPEQLIQQVSILLESYCNALIHRLLLPSVLGFNSPRVLLQLVMIAAEGAKWLVFQFS